VTARNRAALPLAAAAERLRGKPGRPRKTESGREAGIAEGEDRADGKLRPEGRTYLAIASISPRLFGLPAAAAYLGLSGWTIRDLEANGTLRRVSIPLPGGRELRKLLFDRADLDRLVEAWKQR